MISANFQSNVEELDSNIWGYALHVPFEIAKQFIDGNNKRIICSIDGIDPFKCALLGSGNGNFMIVLNKKRRLSLIENGIRKLTVKIDKDTSELGMDVSDEFLEVLSQYELANDYFKLLTPGKKRTLIYWADNVKSSEIKIRRAIVVCEHLITQKGSVDFKLLNEEVKVANAKYKQGINRW